MAQLLQVRVSDELGEWLAARAEVRGEAASPSMRARRELELWSAALRLELAAFPLRVEEALLLADVTSGTAADDDFTGGGLADALEGVRRAYPDLYGQKWGVDEQALLARLRAAGPVLHHALKSALCEWWAQDTTPDEVTDEESLRAVGLRIVEVPTDRATRCPAEQ